MRTPRTITVNKKATHDHITFRVTNNKVELAFNEERYGHKDLLWDSGSQFEISIQEKITGKIWDFIEQECDLTDCIDCTEGCQIKKLREILK